MVLFLLFDYRLNNHTSKLCLLCLLLLSISGSSGTFRNLASKLCLKPLANGEMTYSSDCTSKDAVFHLTKDGYLQHNV